jgi:hypothetical protein
MAPAWSLVPCRPTTADIGGSPAVIVHRALGHVFPAQLLPELNCERYTAAFYRGQLEYLPQWRARLRGTTVSVPAMWPIARNREAFMHAVWVIIGVLVAAGLWWVFFMRKAPAHIAQSEGVAGQADPSSIPARDPEVNTQSAGTIQVLAVLVLISWPILWFAAAGEESWPLFFAGCAALSQGIFLWGFSNIVENLAHIRHNTGRAPTE